MPTAQTLPSGPQLSQRPGTSSGLLDTQNGAGGQESSKFRRFFKRFGRRVSDDGQDHGSNDVAGGHEDGQAGLGGDNGKSSNFGTSRSGKGGKSGGTKGKRFFSPSSANPAPPAPTDATKVTNGNPGLASAPANRLATGFGASNVKGLANTLTLPSGTGTPPPQLEGVPHHDPIATGDLMMPPPPVPGAQHTLTNGEQYAAQQSSAKPTSTLLTVNGLGATQQHNQQLVAPSSAAGAAGEVGVNDKQGIDNVLSQQSSYGSSRSGIAPSSDHGSHLHHDARIRDSVDNRTNDTGKSRASTKPTTLMSMDTRETATTGANMPVAAQIAQHRHGDVTPSQHRQPASQRSAENGAAGAPAMSAPSAIQFVSAPPMGRTVSGTIIQLPNQHEPPEEVPYTNVPSLSRPHPANNPHPAGLPADNASMLTLASSTAAASLGGGAASSRGHQSHAAASLGGARSIGGSLMGERRNSYDTYASVMALPPLSRRGSDSSTRTGRSVAASATGRSSAQAMMGAATGPGAPGDRISIHRTPSQKTIATQLSIPLSTSNQAVGAVGLEQNVDTGSGGNAGHLAAPHSAALGSSPLAVPYSDSNDVTGTSTDAKASAQGTADAGTRAVPSITTSQHPSSTKEADIDIVQH